MLAIGNHDLAVAIRAWLIRQKLHGIEVQVTNEFVIDDQTVATVPDLKRSVKEAVLPAQVAGKHKFPDLGIIIQNQHNGPQAKSCENLPPATWPVTILQLYDYLAALA